MRRRIVLCATAAVAAMAVAGASTALAAPAKLKVKKGSYTVTAVPDPTMEATGLAGMQCFDIDPASVNNHLMKLPGKGTLNIVLDSPDPVHKMDWDLHLLDAHGNFIASSDGPTAHEEIDATGVKGTVTIRSCNLMGEPTANVSWVFTYR